MFHAKARNLPAKMFRKSGKFAHGGKVGHGGEVEHGREVGHGGEVETRRVGCQTFPVMHTAVEGDPG